MHGSKNRNPFLGTMLPNDPYSCSVYSIIRLSSWLYYLLTVYLDLNECDIKTGAYCDRNSLCRNKHGSFSCDPCKNNFIGDGRICQSESSNSNN
jgi:hypothetical protein